MARQDLDMHPLEPYPVMFGITQTQDELDAFFRHCKYPRQLRKKAKYGNENIKGKSLIEFSHLFALSTALKALGE